MNSTYLIPMYLVFIFQVPCLNFLPVPKENLTNSQSLNFSKEFTKVSFFIFEWKVEVHVLYSACRQIEHLKSRSIIHLFTQSKKSYFILTYLHLQQYSRSHFSEKRRETSTFSQTCYYKASTSYLGTTIPSTYLGFVIL